MTCCYHSALSASHSDINSKSSTPKRLSHCYIGHLSSSICPDTYIVVAYTAITGAYTAITVAYTAIAGAYTAITVACIAIAVAYTAITVAYTAITVAYTAITVAYRDAITVGVLRTTSSH